MREDARHWDTGLEMDPVRVGDEYHVTVESDHSTSTTVVGLVATVQGVKLTALPPLAEVVDPDSLDALFESSPGGRRRPNGFVRFHYADCVVTVHDDGEVVVRPEDHAELVEN